MASPHDSDGEDGGLDMFKDPEGFYEPERPATTVMHTTLSGRQLSLRLVGQSPLWVGMLSLHVLLLWGLFATSLSSSIDFDSLHLSARAI